MRRDETSGENQTGTQQSGETKRRLSGPVRVGLFFALLAILLSLTGLWRENNLSLRNVLLAIALGGGTWGVISWAIATAVVQVEEDVASQEGSSTEKS